MSRFLLGLAACSLIAAEPSLYFSKSFPGSVPAFVAITVEKNGACTYQEEVDDANPLRFQMTEQEAAEMFSLADRLDRFKRPLESPLKVAKMGMKTFRFVDGTKKDEVQFNFSEDLDARALTDWFEKISETGQLFVNVERSVKYDKLGVNKAILLLEAAMDRKRVVGLQAFLPLLDRVVKNESYINMARARAASLAEVIRAAK
ncbi:MAG: hypothetical protein ACRD8O_24555 [Bryobacteraceae bacterium]